MNRNAKTALIIGGVIVVILVALSVVQGLLWGGQYEGWGMMGHGMMGGYGAMFLMPVLWIVILGLIVWAVVAAVHKSGESGNTARTADSALEILKRRYAGGEIAKEEYEEKKKDII